MNETPQAGEMVLHGTTDLAVAKKAQLDLNNFIASMMRDKTDYGIIPGTKKPGLWKPGAEKLIYFNGLGVRITCTEKVQDWDKGFFHYEHKATIFHKRTGTDVAECIGSANSKEARYAWRWVSDKKIPRGINIEDLQSKEGQYGTVYRIENEDKFTLPNTLQKQSQKRAMVGAALLACRASENFTAQEVEEEQGPADTEDKTAAKKAKPVSQPKAASAPAGGPPAADRITEGKLKRLRAIKSEQKVSDAELDKHLAANYPYTVGKDGQVHYSWIKWKGKDYENIIAHIEMLGEQPPAEG